MIRIEKTADIDAAAQLLWHRDIGVTQLAVLHEDVDQGVLGPDCDRDGLLNQVHNLPVSGSRTDPSSTLYEAEVRG